MVVVAQLRTPPKVLSAFLAIRSTPLHAADQPREKEVMAYSSSRVGIRGIVELQSTIGRTVVFIGPD